MRLFVCIGLLLVFSPLLRAQSTQPGKGLSDTLAPAPVSVSIPEDADLGDYFDSWTIGYISGKLVPKSHFATFGKLDPKAPMPENNLYMIHIIDWFDDAAGDKDAPQIRFLSSDWYVYRYTGKSFENVAPDGKELPPIYGPTSAVLISISRITMKVNRDTAVPFIDYTVTTTERKAANVAALEALIGGVLNITTTKGAPAKLGIAPDQRYSFRVQVLVLNAKPLHAPFDVAMTAKATPKVPEAPIVTATSHDSPKDSTGSAAKAPPTKTSDCSPLVDKSNCTFSRTVTVDSRQYWDVGINIVLHGPRENRYALSNSNIVTQTHTHHSALIATFDLSPWAYKFPMNKYPYLQVGVPLSGAAFHLPYFGVAQPLTFTKKWLPISAYGGIVLMKQTFPRTLTVGEASNTAAFNADLTTDWPIKVIYGIEVPVSSIISKVKSSVGSGK